MHPKKERNKVLWDILKQPGISYLNSLLWNVTFERNCTRLSFWMHSKLERDSASICSIYLILLT